MTAPHILDLCRQPKMKAIPELDPMTTSIRVPQREIGSVQQASGIEQDDFEPTVQGYFVPVQSHLQTMERPQNFVEHHDDCSLKRTIAAQYQSTDFHQWHKL